MSEAKNFTSYLFVLALTLSNISADPRIILPGSYAPSQPSVDWPWTESVLFPGDLFTVSRRTRSCEQEIGNGQWEISGDTLTLRNLRTWSTLDCKSDLVESLILPEKSFRIRTQKKSTFEAQSLQAQGKISKWTRLCKVGQAIPAKGQ